MAYMRCKSRLRPRDHLSSVSLVSSEFHTPVAPDRPSGFAFHPFCASSWRFGRFKISEKKIYIYRKKCAANEAIVDDCMNNLSDFLIKKNAVYIKIYLPVR